MQIQITTYGVLHGRLPASEAPEVVRVDLTERLRNPAEDPELEGLTGLDWRMSDHVMGTEGAEDVLEETVAAVEKAVERVGVVDVEIFCRGGLHRSVALGEKVAARFSSRPGRVQIRHRDVMKGVVT